ncbi:MAG: radical SAM protein [Candidatus Magasanikbacteria bacterium]|nr:radical SAM protein [Candidatus Magasanikbacteria bacterium]
MGKIIEVRGNSALIELTTACLTGCKEYCYRKCGIPSLDPKLHVPFELLIKRLEWIRKFTDANRIYLVGGEPLLYPKFSSLCDKILEMGYKLSIITSGKVNKKSSKNIDKLIELFKDEKIDIELSYHHKLNKKFYFSLLEKLEEAEEQRIKENPIKAILNTINPFNEARGVLTTATIYSDRLMSREEYIKFNEDIAKLYCDIEKAEEISTITDDGTTDFLSSLIGDYSILRRLDKKLFVRRYTYDRNHKRRLKLVLKIWRATEIVESEKANLKFNIVFGNYGISCPAMNSSIEKGFVKLQSLLIRTDGELCFSTPSCVATKEQLGNINNLSTKEEIIERMSKHFSMIMGIGIRAKRLDDYPEINMKCNSDNNPGCSAFAACDGHCNTRDMCSICSAIRY